MHAYLTEINSNFTTEYGSVKVAMPNINFFLKKIENKEHFHFLRMNHGFFDRSAIAAEHILGNSLSTFSNSKEHAKSMTLTKSLSYPGKKWFGSVKDLLYEQSTLAFLNDVKIKDIDNFYIAVSDSFGFGWDQVGKRNNTGWPSTYVQMKSVLNLDSNKPYMHGGLFRHYSVKNELNDFFEFFKHDKYHFIVVGPNYYKGYRPYFGKTFTHIEINSTNAINDIISIKKKCKDSIKPNLHNVILVSLEIGCYPISRFFRIEKELNATIIDIGRALDYLIKDQIKQPWLEENLVDLWSSRVDSMRNKLSIISETKL